MSRTSRRGRSQSPPPNSPTELSGPDFLQRSGLLFAYDELLVALVERGVSRDNQDVFEFAARHFKHFGKRWKAGVVSPTRYARYNYAAEERSRQTAAATIIQTRERRRQASLRKKREASNLRLQALEQQAQRERDAAAAIQAAARRRLEVIKPTEETVPETESIDAPEGQLEGNEPVEAASYIENTSEQRAKREHDAAAAIQAAARRRLDAIKPTEETVAEAGAVDHGEEKIEPRQLAVDEGTIELRAKRERDAAAAAQARAAARRRSETTKSTEETLAAAETVDAGAETVEAKEPTLAVSEMVEPEEAAHTTPSLNAEDSQSLMCGGVEREQEEVKVSVFEFEDAKEAPSVGPGETSTTTPPIGEIEVTTDEGVSAAVATAAPEKVEDENIRSVDEAISECKQQVVKGDETEKNVIGAEVDDEKKPAKHNEGGVDAGKALSEEVVEHDGKEGEEKENHAAAV